MLGTLKSKKALNLKEQRQRKLEMILVFNDMKEGKIIQLKVSFESELPKKIYIYVSFVRGREKKR